MFVTAMPEFPVLDLAVTQEFYRGLGFWPHIPKDKKYLDMYYQSIGIRFYLQPDLQPIEGHHSCVIQFKDEKAYKDLYAAFKRYELPEAGMPRLRQLVGNETGISAFEMVDVSGNLVRVELSTE